MPASLDAEGDEIEDGFTLEVDKCAILDCEMEELRELILYLIATHKFDVADLSNLSATAVLYRNKKRGMTNVTVDPPPFRRLRPIRRNAITQGKSRTQQKDGSSNVGAMSVAAVFALVLLIGAVALVARRKGK